MLVRRLQQCARTDECLPEPFIRANLVVASAPRSLLRPRKQQVCFNQSFDDRADDTVSKTCEVGNHANSQLITSIGRQHSDCRHHFGQVPVAKHSRRPCLQRFPLLTLHPYSVPRDAIRVTR
jgi:hypothetical protein